MKLGLFCFLLTGMSFASNFPGGAGPDVTDCLKWSGMTFCMNYYGSISLLSSQATSCQASHGADGFVIFTQFRKIPNQPTVRYYKIYTRRCEVKKVKGIAPSDTGDLIASQLSDLFPMGPYVSNSHINEQGEIKLFVWEHESNTTFEGTFDEEGNLLQIEQIDPETYEYYLAVIEATGLEFGKLMVE